MPNPIQEFEQITWNDWIHHYWIKTVSQFEPILFIKACKHSHEGHEHTHVQNDGQEELYTAFVEGADGYTYKMVRQHGVAGLSPVYTLKQG